LHSQGKFDTELAKTKIPNKSEERVCFLSITLKTSIEYILGNFVIKKLFFAYITIILYKKIYNRS